VSFLLPSGSVSYRGKIKGIDRAKDVAVIEVIEDIKGRRLRIEEGQFCAIEKGSSSSLQVGQYAIAIGNPFGLALTELSLVGLKEIFE
jgi:S1-C subfamily serine protease